MRGTLELLYYCFFLEIQNYFKIKRFLEAYLFYSLLNILQSVLHKALHICSSASMGSTKHRSKYSGKKVCLYQTCADFFLVFIPQTIHYNSYLHNIYTALLIISNLEMIESIWEDIIICKFYAIFNKRLEHLQILLSWGWEGSPGTNPLWIQMKDYITKINYLIF